MMKRAKKNNRADTYSTIGGLLIALTAVNEFVEGDLIDSSTKKVVGKGRWTKDGHALFGTQFTNPKKTLSALTKEHDFFDLKFTTVFKNPPLKQ